MDERPNEPAEGPPIDLVAAEAARDPIGRFDAEVRDALSVVAGTSRLLEQRWDQLSDDRRLQMVEVVARRSEELQAALLPVLTRLLASRSTL